MICRFSSTKCRLVAKGVQKRAFRLMTSGSFDRDGEFFSENKWLLFVSNVTPTS
jgi:hypothetical protein